ncbi:MAG: hypothetical protein R3E39_29975 [Anaerolineae bacterium]
MGARSYWYNVEHTILMQQYEGKCVAADFFKCIDEANQFASEVEHDVDIIVDMREAMFVGTSFLTARGAAETKYLKNQRLAVLVGASAFIRMLVSIGKKIAPKTTRNIHFVETIDEALHLINETNQARA